MSYRQDVQAESERSRLLEKAAVWMYAAHLGRDCRHVDRPYAPADAIIYGGLWEFIECKTRTYRVDPIHVPIRKVRNLIDLCVEHEAIPVLLYWVTDTPLGKLMYLHPDETLLRECDLGEKMNPNKKRRAGVSEDDGGERRLDIPHDRFTIIFDDC